MMFTDVSRETRKAIFTVPRDGGACRKFPAHEGLLMQSGAVENCGVIKIESGNK